jgi:inner membrane protein
LPRRQPVEDRHESIEHSLRTRADAITVSATTRFLFTEADTPPFVYRKGHWGVSLLLFAPVGSALVALGQQHLAFVGGAVMVWLAMLPDVDIRIPGLSHRGSTHTLAFAALVGLAFGAVGFVLGTPLAPASRVELAVFGFGIGALTVLAHLVADALTPMGVAFFWPLSSRRFSLGVVRADSTVGNDALFVLGVFVTAALAVLTLRPG